MSEPIHLDITDADGHKHRVDLRLYQSQTPLTSLVRVDFSDGNFHHVNHGEAHRILCEWDVRAKRKTLEDAIGCWTTDPSALHSRHIMVGQSLKSCRRLTQENADPERLLAELRLLQERTKSFAEIVASGVTRCAAIIEGEECRFKIGGAS